MGGRDHSEARHRSGGESHDHRGLRSARKLALVAGINLVGFVVELAGGLLFGSIALVSDAVHMWFDALAYLMAFAAAYLAANYEGSERWSYGLHRLEPLSAFLNGALLFPMVGFVLWEAYQRFLDPVVVGTGPTLVVAVGGLAINLLSVYVLGGGEMTLNERGAFYHLLGDAGGSVAVVVAVVGVELTGIRALDPAAAVLIAAAIVWSAGELLLGSGAIFLHRTPLDAAAVRADLADLPGVESVEDFHAWQICSEITVATAHVRTSSETVAEVDDLNRRIHELLADYGVDHATVELHGGGLDRESHLTAHGH